MEQRTSNGIGFITGRWPLDPLKSTIVLIHGAGGSSFFWQAQVEALAERVNTVAIDLPGHGQSHGSGHDRIEDYALAVIDFIRTIKAPKPIPCGISLGGAVAQQLLLDYPDLFKAAIIISSGAKLKVAPDIFDAIEKDIKSYVELMANFAASKSTDPDRVKRFKDDAARCKPEVIIQDFKACDRFDVMPRVGSIRSPVLVVTAEDDQVTPPKYGDFMETSIAKASRVHITEAGHIVPMEKPEEVNRAIVEFLDQAGL
ncbi:MAG: alpha/beta hydrolase [Desulfobacteraceae bacterium]|jgi:pimeloyl-ACP methyl ester carboxylesterase|nr:alpha/beta hydrolase [Desulfobacteraceae bacterium]